VGVRRTGVARPEARRQPIEQPAQRIPIGDGERGQRRLEPGPMDKGHLVEEARAGGRQLHPRDPSIRGVGDTLDVALFFKPIAEGNDRGG